MILMTEQEARATIETYENTFGKELRRRTFRTWNDWAKAEEEFTPKDGSLQYVNKLKIFLLNNYYVLFQTNNNSGTPSIDFSKPKKTIVTGSIPASSSSSSNNDEVKRINKTKIKQEAKVITQSNAQTVPNTKEVKIEII